jgi:hypothetical protein
MNSESVVRPPVRPEWEMPDCEQIRVSAEASAYMGVRQDWQ